MQNSLGGHTSVTHPSLHIRDANDAHIILEAVRLNILPLIKRRLATTEREQLKTGNVFVWEEAEDDGGLLRWTDGRRWSQSRMRGDYLYYEEKVETTQDEKDAKAARRARRASDPTAIIPPPTRRKDRPTKPNGLTKQTYSALVQLPGSPSPKKWHVVAYFSGNDYTRLPVIENYEYLRNVRVPPGIYVSSKAGARLDQMPAFPEEIDDYGTPERHFHPPGEMHTDPRGKAHLQTYPGHYTYGYPTSPSTSSSPPSSMMTRSNILKPMREILYIQAGSFANYTGTHFWNTQEEYFTYDDETEPLVNHDISFREGIDQHAEESIWDGDILAYKQEPISSAQPTNYDAPGVRSSPEARIDNEVGDGSDGLEEPPPKVSFWPDFARVSYIPRSIQKIPDSPGWDHLNGNWEVGRKTFFQYNEETDLMDGAVRRSLEECDSPQGIQIIEDTLTFGSFIDSFISSFRDEFSRLPILSFPLLSQSIPTRSGTEGIQPRDLKFMINDALVLRTYNDIDSALAVPISPSAAWAFPETAGSPTVDVYSASAMLCSHLESSTLPTRLVVVITPLEGSTRKFTSIRLRNRSTSLSLTSLLAQLNWRGINRFSHLSGAFLSKTTERFDGSLSVSDFSLPANKSPSATLFAISDVTRGLTPEELLSYDKWRSQAPPSFSPGTSFHAPSYPSSEGLPSVKVPTGSSSQTPLQADNCPGRLFTRMTTTTGTAAMFDAYARLIENEISRKPGLLVQSCGLDLDELKELVSDLWTMHDNYHDEK
ncbi:hypothetical protein EYR36_010611 [Pleurotus pulmonarius]|nr:hypothetical protein EYR36_010611 [Pleurotus pulmonarius]